MAVLRKYRGPALSPGAQETTLAKLEQCTDNGLKLDKLETELCFFVQLEAGCEGKLQVLYNLNSSV